MYIYPAKFRAMNKQMYWGKHFHPEDEERLFELLLILDLGYWSYIWQ